MSWKAIAKDGATAAELCLAKDHVRGKTMLAFEDSDPGEWYGCGYSRKSWRRRSKNGEI